MLRRIAAVVMPLVILAACGGAAQTASEPGATVGAIEPAESEPAASEPAASEPAASVSATTGDGGGAGMATVDLTITGGQKEGHYVAEITEGGCSTGATGPGTFSVASVTVDPDTDFDGPQLTIYDAAAAAGGTDEEFSAAFVFDNYSYTVEVNPKIDLGTGTATLDNRGSSATVTIEGTSSDGDAVSATIECHSVTNF